MRRIFLTLLLICVLLSSTLVSAAARTYQVRPGDTLYAISQQTGVPVARLIQLNNITNPDSLTVGQILVLDETAQGAEDTEEGLLDTLWRWTQNYGWIGIFLLLKSVGVL